MITKSNLNSAIAKINTEGIIEDDYYIYANGRLYPPHLVISYADSIVNSTPFATDFTTGVLSNTDKTLLETNDFRLVPKGFESNDFSLTIINWIRHSYHQAGKCYGHSCPAYYRGLQVYDHVPDYDGDASYILAFDPVNGYTDSVIFPCVVAHRNESVMFFALGGANAVNRWPNGSSYQTIRQYLVSQGLTTSGAGPYLDYLVVAVRGVGSSTPNSINAEFVKNTWNDMVDIYLTTLIP